MDARTIVEHSKVFWKNEKQSAPLITMRYGNAFSSRMFEANLPLLKDNLLITPDMIDPERYVADYERLFHEYSRIEQEGWYSCEPMCGFPWIEAMMGARVFGSASAFITKHITEEIDEVHLPENILDTEWCRIYMEFHRLINEAGQGRFTSGQPIIRGVDDTLGAIMGATPMIYAMYEEPEKVEELYMKIAEDQRVICEEMYKYVQPIEGGYVVGFYNIWCPGKIIWYQNDLTAVLSPDNFTDFIKKANERICEGYDYTLVHVHPTSFHMLDEILSTKGLKCVQVNKDNNGPTVRDMIPQLRKIQEAGKVMLVKGTLNQDDADAVLENLEPHGVAIQSFNPTVDGANEFLDYVRDRAAKLW